MVSFLYPVMKFIFPPTKEPDQVILHFSDFKDMKPNSVKVFSWGNKPGLVKRLSVEFITWVKSRIDITKRRIDVVLSPITGGRLLAFDIAREFNGIMDCQTAYARVNAKGQVLPYLHPASFISRGDNVLDHSVNGAGCPGR